MKSNLTRGLFLLIGTFAFIGTSLAQIQVQQTQSVQQLIQNVLVGAGVSATNITVNNGAIPSTNTVLNAAYFNAQNTNLPIASGVLLTTGSAAIAVGPNNSGTSSGGGGSLVNFDADLNSIANASVTNGIVIEFDFIATGNQLNFNYVFASEEYPEFAPPNSSSFNDIFGFFLSGPGITGPYTNNAINIAQVPGTTTPVSINNVNAITNNSYYVNNVNGATYGTAIQYDGTTTNLVAFSNLQCGQTYHIKLAIANCGDQGYDSGVFLEEGSFTVNPVEFEFNTFTLDNNMYEGCEHISQLIFNRAGCGNELDTLVAWVALTGTATNGTDYSLLGDSVILLPGVNQVIWDIQPFEDYQVEGMETIEIHVRTYIELTGDTLHGYGTFYIHDRPIMQINGVDQSYYCLDHVTTLNSVLTGGMQPVTYLWDTGDTTAIASMQIDSNGVYSYVVTVTDGCGYTDTDTVFLTMNQTLAIEDLISSPANCNPIGTIYTMNFPYGAHLQNPNNSTSYNLTFDWTYHNDTNQVFPNQSSLQNLPGGWYTLELTDNVIGCTVTDSVLVDVENVPSAIFNASVTSGCQNLNVTFENTSVNANSYVWDFGNGQTQQTNNTNSQTSTFNYTSTVILVASNGDPTCNDTSTITINIVHCGCSDPLALNYDPNAVINDGSCVFPQPTASAPNVITMNGDNVNDQFFLTTEYAKHIELIILNRWGGIIYQGTGDQNNQPTWNGKDKNSKEVTEGVYFYKYKVVGIMDDEIEGHGFITVVK